MIVPVNGNLIIEPLKHDSFIQSEKDKFEEVGVVVDYDKNLTRNPELIINNGYSFILGKGDKVYFDSWLATKFPKNDKEYFWIVNWKDIKAIEYAD